MSSPEVIELARVSAGLSQTALATKLGKSQPFISQVESGERDLPPDLLPAWAAACGVSPSLLTRGKPPFSESVSAIVHRRMKTLPAKPFAQANGAVRLTAVWVDRLFAEVEVEPAYALPSFPSGVGPADAAAALRRQWRVPGGPLPNLIGLVEDAGIPVVASDVFHEKLSAASLRGEWFDWMIVVNAQHPASRRRFNIAHELGHIVLGHDRLSPEAGGPRDLEREADAFAAALLLPEAELRRELKNVDLRRLVALKRRWQVSIGVLIETAWRAGVITAARRQGLWVELSSLPGGRRREPAEFEAEEPTLLRKMVESLLAEGLTVAEVADLALMDEETLRVTLLGERRRLRALEDRPRRAALRLADTPG